MRTPVILSAARSPIGSFQGALSSLSAPELGAKVIAAAVERAEVRPDQVTECIMGQVLTAGAKQAPARQAALGAGLLPSTPCLTINKVCGSGLKAVMLASDSIQLGHNQVMVAGGQESMSQAPYLLKGARDGYRMGHQQLVDSMIFDGLWDPYNDFHMGQAAELCGKEYKLSREAQDDFAQKSYEKALMAQKNGWFTNEIVPVEVPSRKQPIVVSEDEEPARGNFAKMRELRPAFDKAGSITAANASKINDGAAALVLASEEWAKSQGAKPLARILGHSTYAHEPKWFTTAPVNAMKNLLNQLQLKSSDIDFYEINEAFSAVTMAAQQELSLSSEQVNPYGGAVALGHPIGASGARILTTLIHALIGQKKKRGMASICLGGGEAVAVALEIL